MEELKVYAHAKDVKLPRLINDILEEHINNMNLSNTWSNDPLNLFITIPKKYPNNIVNLPKSITNTLDGWQFEVKAMPTNLDVWNDKHGYISRQKEFKHEGVEPLLIPNAIDELTLKKDDTTSQAIAQCLIGLYFMEDMEGNIRVDLIPFNSAIAKLQFAQNETAKFYMQYRTMLNGLINDNLINLNEVNHDKIKQQLLDQLEDLAKSINTGNIAPVVINSQDIDQQPLQKFDASMPMPGLSDLLNEIDQLKKENAQYKESMEKLSNEHEELKNDIKKIEDIIKKVEELEAMNDAELLEMWEKKGH